MLQFLVCGITLFGSLGTGIGMIFPTVTLPEYQSTDHPVLGAPLSEDQGSWFVSIGHFWYGGKDSGFILNWRELSQNGS